MEKRTVAWSVHHFVLGLLGSLLIIVVTGAILFGVILCGGRDAVAFFILPVWWLVAFVVKKTWKGCPF